MLRKYILNNLKNGYTPNGLSLVPEVAGNTIPPLLVQGGPCLMSNRYFWQLTVDQLSFLAVGILRNVLILDPKWLVILAYYLCSDS